MKAGGASGWIVVATQPANRSGRTTRDESNIVEFAGRDAIADPLTELLRKGARELLQSAVEAELEVFMARFQGRKTLDGHAAVIRNGPCRPVSGLSR